MTNFVNIIPARFPSSLQNHAQIQTKEWEDTKKLALYAIPID